MMLSQAMTPSIGLATASNKATLNETLSVKFAMTLFMNFYDTSLCLLATFICIIFLPSDSRGKLCTVVFISFSYKLTLC